MRSDFLKNTTEYLVTGLSVMLLFFMVFRGFLVVPAAISWLGHWHPVVLHVPIVMIPVTIIQYWRKDKALDWYLAFATLATLVAALSGMLLSLESEGAGDLLIKHQWMGCAMAAVMVFWYFSRSVSWRNIIVVAQVVLVVGIVITGHLGGQITHGKDFLSFSSDSESKYAEKELPDDPVVFADVVWPLLQARCASCHNQNKTKGKLTMDTYQHLLAGGKTGHALNISDFKSGELYKRISLPKDDKHHMPPTDEHQLTAEEVTLLSQWMALGSSDTIRYSGLAANEDLKQIITAKLKRQQMKKWKDLPTVEDDILVAQSDAYCHILRMYKTSDALQVLIFPHKGYSPELLAGLKTIAENIVELDLHNLPLGGQDMELISRFKNLERLDISNTGIDDASFEKLQPLGKLYSLRAYGTKLTGAGLTMLNKFQSLKSAYLFDTPVRDAEIGQFVAEHPGINVLKNAPESMNFHAVLPVPKLTPKRYFFKEPFYVHFQHPLQRIKIRYTQDGSLPADNSELVTDSLLIDKETQLKYFAELEGWESSAIDSAYFWHAGLVPDKTDLKFAPSKKYPGKAKKLLFDLEKGPADNSDSAWMAFREHPMVLTCTFTTPTDIHRLIISSVLHTDPIYFSPTTSENFLPATHPGRCACYVP